MKKLFPIAVLALMCGCGLYERNSLLMMENCRGLADSGMRERCTDAMLHDGEIVNGEKLGELYQQPATYANREACMSRYYQYKQALDFRYRWGCYGLGCDAPHIEVARYFNSTLPKPGESPFIEGYSQSEISKIMQWAYSDGLHELNDQLTRMVEICGRLPSAPKVNLLEWSREHPLDPRLSIDRPRPMMPQSWYDRMTEWYGNGNRAVAIGDRP